VHRTTCENRTCNAAVEAFVIATILVMQGRERLVNGLATLNRNLHLMLLTTPMPKLGSYLHPRLSRPSDSEQLELAVPPVPASNLQRVVQESTTFGSSRWGHSDILDSALSTEALKPSTVVELGVVLLDLSIGVDLHNIDAINRVLERGNAPSPVDGVALSPDVEDGDLDFRLVDTLASVESGLAWEGDGAELSAFVS
jgi:hypothetical protein